MDKRLDGVAVKQHHCDRVLRVTQDLLGHLLVNERNEFCTLDISVLNVSGVE